MVRKVFREYQVLRVNQDQKDQTVKGDRREIEDKLDYKVPRGIQEKEVWLGYLDLMDLMEKQDNRDLRVRNVLNHQLRLEKILNSSLSFWQAAVF